MTQDASITASQITDWMSEHVPGFQGPLIVQRVSGGQSNPTFRLETPKHSYILRRKPPGKLLKSAHAVDREFRVQRALAATDVPVAKMYALCEDDGVIGSAFYVMDEVRGRTFDDPRLPELPPNDRAKVIDAMNLILTRIHDVDLETAGLTDFGPSGNYYRRQTDRWTQQYEASQTSMIPDMDNLGKWLDRNMPEDDGQRTLVHGDYRLDNLMYDLNGTDIVAVLDWELSTIGHPYADLAAVVMQWSMPPGSKGRGLAGVDRQRHGLWSDQHFIDMYCKRRGLAPIKNFGFYLAFCYFRMAAILQGVKKRALDGNAADPERALELGAYVPQFAEMGLRAAKG